jgi:hypothetical protein
LHSLARGAAGAGERQSRAAAEEAKAGLEAERSRLLKRLDDATAQLRVAQRQVAEAEDEAVGERRRLGAARALSLT